MVLNSILKNDKPLGKNIPTSSAFKVKENTGDLEEQKSIWLRLLADYQNFSNDRFIHDFFGKMTREEIGRFAYKHSDHHLRQFGA